MKYFSILTAMCGVLFIAGCATEANQNVGISEKAAKELAQYQPTGETKKCINTSLINSIDAIDEKHFLVRVRVSDYYINRVKGRCSGADRGFSRLQYKAISGSLCRNEIISVVDSGQGFMTGSCSLGEFERVEKIDPQEEQ